MRRIIDILLLLLILGGGYIYRTEIKNLAGQVYDIAFPCTRPITYSVGQFDTDFSITRQQLLTDIARAETAWETALGRNLFELTDGGVLKVNLIYDYRQQTTQQLSTIGNTIKSGSADYDNLKIKYQAALANYNSEKVRVTTAKAQYDADLKRYNEEADYWNQHGGLKKTQYDQLQTEKARLDRTRTELNQAVAYLNEMADTVNDGAKELNSMAEKLNLTVDNYNTIGRSTGEEFDEGIYIQDAKSRHIDVYQFSNNDQLVRLLTHELGHAIGMDHVDDEMAIMYRLNQGKNLEPTNADIAELRRVCKIK